MVSTRASGRSVVSSGKTEELAVRTKDSGDGVNFVSPATTRRRANIIVLVPPPPAERSTNCRSNENQADHQASEIDDDSLYATAQESPVSVRGSYEKTKECESAVQEPPLSSVASISSIADKPQSQPDSSSDQTEKPITAAVVTPNVPPLDARSLSSSLDASDEKRFDKTQTRSILPPQDQLTRSLTQASHDDSRGGWRRFNPGKRDQTRDIENESSDSPPEMLSYRSLHHRKGSSLVGKKTGRSDGDLTLVKSAFSRPRKDADMLSESNKSLTMSTYTTATNTTSIMPSLSSKLRETGTDDGIDDSHNPRLSPKETMGPKMYSVQHQNLPMKASRTIEAYRQHQRSGQVGVQSRKRSLASHIVDNWETKRSKFMVNS